MKVIGIIAEYNPFHNGHRYQIEEARRLTGADYVIVIMSPDFVQRGEPAIADRYARAKTALLGGADLCIALPVCSAVSSAEFFAEGAVRILDGLNVVNALSFGCEFPLSAALPEIVHILNTEPEAYRQKLTSALAEGIPFPAAREAALISCLEQTRKLSAQPEEAALIIEWLRSPNCTLGLEYLRALDRIGSSIQPLPILRMGCGYHDTAFSDIALYPSATALRMRIAETGFDAQVRSGIPDSTLETLLNEPLYCSDGAASAYDRLLHYRLLTETAYTDYLDINADLSRRITNLLPDYTGAEAFAHLLKSRQITLTRARRILLHLFLGLRTETAMRFHHNPDTYAQVLGFRKSAAPLLRKIRSESRIPVITCPSDAKKLLSPDAMEFYAADLNASRLYQLLLSQTEALFNTGYAVPAEKKLRNEFARSPVIINDTL